MKKSHLAIATLITTALSTIAYRWLSDKASTPKLSSSTVISTDPDSGSKLIEVTGVGGKDDGKKVTGYELSENSSGEIFPLKVVVRPNQNLFGDWMITVGQTAVLNKRNDDMVYWDNQTGENAGTYLVSYAELKQKALRSV